MLFQCLARRGQMWTTVKRQVWQQQKHCVAHIPDPSKSRGTKAFLFSSRNWLGISPVAPPTTWHAWYRSHIISQLGVELALFLAYGRPMGKAHLPPVGIFPVDDLKDVTFLEGYSRLPTGNQVVVGGIVVKVWPHVYLGTDTRTVVHSRLLLPTLHPTQSFTTTEAFARQGKCSGSGIRLNRQPREAIKQGGKIYCAKRPEPRSRM